MLLTRNRFITLADTPTSYSGASNQIARVNSAEDALEFAPASALGLAHADLSGVTGLQHHATLFPNMDDAGGTTWGIPGWRLGAATSVFIGQHRRIYVPCYVERSRTYTLIGCHVFRAVVGAVVRLGIYAADFDGSGEMTPGALTLDAGTVSVATTGEKSIVINQTLGEGFHFLVISTGSAGVELIGPDTSFGISTPATGRSTTIGGNDINMDVVVDDGAAALPDPATAPTALTALAVATIQIGDS